MTETGIDYQITFLCRQIRYLQAKKRCEICDEYVGEQGSELSRPHMHHYFDEAGVPWEFRHNPAFFVCLDRKHHKIEMDSPHKDKHDFRRKYLLKLKRINLPRWYVLKAAEERLERYTKGLIVITNPPPEHKKMILTQLRRELKRVEDDYETEIVVCQVPPGRKI